jgi:hypothetical protein
MSMEFAWRNDNTRPRSEIVDRPITKLNKTFAVCYVKDLPAGMVMQLRERSLLESDERTMETYGCRALGELFS